ncbi:type I-E CRISPR-associated protein Cse2/CasB [Kitasatospora sp. NPDC096140]|uniref:type I-E CRISPR-associated protein Cse2/CasB n=1 Tax=Kitasatospora sp. NPDC096140 TaxID=3155425 RepID=UPI00332E01DE
MTDSVTDSVTDLVTGSAPPPEGPPAGPPAGTEGPAEPSVRQPAPADPAPGKQLTSWLCGLVRARQTGQLADLRRPAAVTRARLDAAEFAPSEETRPVFEHVAFLFARYHAGRLDPSPGAGDIGAALRRIGSGEGRGPANPGAVRLLDRVVASRRVPWRHLQHVIERARSCDTVPPSWAVLAEDLAGWSGRGRPVQYRWARSFYTPTFTPDTRTLVPGSRGTEADPIGDSK